MTGMIRRGLRLELVAGLGIALAVPALAFAAQSGNAQDAQPLLKTSAQSVSTRTSLVTELHDQAGRTQAALSVTVTGDDRQAARGSVAIRDNGVPVAGAALDEQGRATLQLALGAGPHNFTAVYTGDTTHKPSTSQAAQAEAQAAATPDFNVSVAPATLSITAGNSGTAVVSITPENASSLTAPMFVTLSCSALPDQAACTYTPANLEILPNATAPVTSSLVILTQHASASLVHPGAQSSVALAILLPGAFALGGLAWSLRGRTGLQRLVLLALLAFVSALGTTACNSRYNYYNHGPPTNPATPAGTYTVQVTAQSSNGVTATTHSTTLALTVN